jgi:hypothetical protein
MKAYVIAILVGIALISVALTTVSGHIQNYNNNSSEQIYSNQPDITLLDAAPLPTTATVSFGVVVQEVITTALLVIGSIVVLRKK